MRARQLSGLVLLVLVFALVAGAVFAQPPMRQARPGNGEGSDASAALESNKPPVGPDVEPGTLDPAAGPSTLAAASESGESRATESGAARPARAPKMAHTGINLIALYGLSALALGAGAALWAASRKQLRAHV